MDEERNYRVEGVELKQFGARWTVRVTVKETNNEVSADIYYNFDEDGERAAEFMALTARKVGDPQPGATFL